MPLFGNEQQETHSALNTVKLAVFLAVSHFNDGASSISLVLQKLGIKPGVHCKNAGKKMTTTDYAILAERVQTIQRREEGK